jgi:hypothetical protein
VEAVLPFSYTALPYRKNPEIASMSLQLPLVCRSGSEG